MAKTRYGSFPRSALRHAKTRRRLMAWVAQAPMQLAQQVRDPLGHRFGNLDCAASSRATAAWISLIIAFVGFTKGIDQRVSWQWRWWSWRSALGHPQGSQRGPKANGTTAEWAPAHRREDVGSSAALLGPSGEQSLDAMQYALVVVGPLQRRPDVT